MSEANIRSKIYTLLNSVTDIGKVYDYERWAVDWGEFVNLFKSSAHNQIRGWEIGRKSALAEYDDNAEESTQHVFVMRGYMSVDDSATTEKTFNALIEAVRATFRFNFTLDSECEFAGPANVTAIDTRTFGGVLCHCCEIELKCTEVVSQ